VTAITVKSVLRSVLSLCGMTAAIASAAEAPQIATAPPVSSAKRHCRPKDRGGDEAGGDGQRDQPGQHRGSTCQPDLRQVVERDADAEQPDTRAAARTSRRSRPRRGRRPSACRKLNAMPSSSANSITGAP
jgi:hypothetical protein